MGDRFFDEPILNSPYEYPSRHWELDETGQPTQKIANFRRRASFLTPIPKPRKQSSGPKQNSLGLNDDEEKSVYDRSGQEYKTYSLINEIRVALDDWRRLPPSDWKVTPETARLLKHWRNHQFRSFRPFFCQVEAVETLIWLTEVLPHLGKKDLLQKIKAANQEANPGLYRVALKMATGSGKTAVMAMIIAWQTVNAVRSSGSKTFTKGFLVVTPGITVRDRLRALNPSDPEAYYVKRELIPPDMAGDIKKAEIVITNYHAFMRRETNPGLTKTSRSLLQGCDEKAPDTLETEGQMLNRVINPLMGMKKIMVLNDEAHHCYRRKPDDPNAPKLRGDEKDEADENNEAARVWINGIESVQNRLGINAVIDLSATPFFLQGSGYTEGTLFPWTVSDFSLMDAIECGIVKLPRVPVLSNEGRQLDMPMFRNIWEHIREKMPKKGRANAGALDPGKLPPELLSALDALYAHYEKTYKLWEEKNITVPPCFIIVCNNTSTSKLVSDYISGYYHKNDKGEKIFRNGHFELFRNYDTEGNSIPLRTLLIDSHQLESGEALNENFRKLAAEEIQVFRKEIIQRTGDRGAAENISDHELLREVMNTVGKEKSLGGQIRCVVSVAMLSEGWDANTVTHVLGIRAFGTQLLCEQVIGRALRRQSYELNEKNIFDVEYADVLGIPFDFTAKPQIADPKPPHGTIHVFAVSPERDALEIKFPRVAGYCAEFAEDRLAAKFSADSGFELTPEIVGPTKTQLAGIIGQGADIDVEHLDKVRDSTIIYKLTQYLIERNFTDSDGQPKLYLFGQLKHITAEWFRKYLRCRSAFPAQILYKVIADEVCNRLFNAISLAAREDDKKPIRAILDPYNPRGSSFHVSFTTSKTLRFKTDKTKCHVNYVIGDSEWELDFAAMLEQHKKVLCYVKNQGLGFEVPYRFYSDERRYLPDFIIVIDDGHGPDNPLNLAAEIKGIRGEDAKEKKNTVEALWAPGVNRLQTWGRWAFAEFTDPYSFKDDFDKFLNNLGA
jgi:type III restriction enzyme